MRCERNVSLFVLGGLYTTPTILSLVDTVCWDICTIRLSYTLQSVLSRSGLFTTVALRSESIYNANPPPRLAECDLQIQSYPGMLTSGYVDDDIHVSETQIPEILFFNNRRLAQRRSTFAIRLRALICMIDPSLPQDDNTRNFIF